MGLDDEDTKPSATEQTRDEDLFDFLEMIGSSKSIVKESFGETKQNKVALETAEKSIFEERNTKGA